MSAIAIVGMGCRFAGAPDLQSYWDMTRAGRDAFGPVPADRWDHEVFFSANRRSTDKSYAPHGAFIQDVRSFPALHFGIPPRRVEVMDPQQRFAIEVGLQAIEDAGYKSSEMPHRTGVFMGVTASEYRTLLGARVSAQLMGSGSLGEAPEDLDVIAGAVNRVVPSRPFSAPGALANMVAAAVAQELDLHGPAYTSDAACASALVALSNAVNLLRNGRIDAAVAGGIYLCLSPENHIAFSRIGAISGEGYCRPFDSRADGFVQGDGAAAILLKRLDDAVRDGDRIYAVINGLAINNDGRGDGPMAPVLEGQTEVIEDAWRDAGIDKSLLGYIEAHGTGTSVGDQTEFTGIMSALGDDVVRAAIGSSKGNVGHTMSAAAMAGIIRTALAIHHGEIPPMAGFESAKDDLGLEESPFDVPVQSRDWDGARVGAVSSFGFGGTNGHAVLSAPPVQTGNDCQVELVRLSAPDLPTLRDLAGRTAAALKTSPNATVAGVARAWAVRSELPARVALTAADLPELIAGLQTFAEGGLPNGAAMATVTSKPRVALLFPGQGAQRIGMMAGILERFPVVANTLDHLESTLIDNLSVPLSHLLYPSKRAVSLSDDAAATELTLTSNCQPAMYACGAALWALLEQIGVKPVAATGHSLGEFNAAAVGGVVSVEDGALFSARRGAAMAGIQGDPGTMLAVRASADVVKALLVDGAVIANTNHPEQCVVSGTTVAVGQVAEKAAAQNIDATALSVSHGFHSTLFDHLDTDAMLAGVTFHDPRITVASGISDVPYASADAAKVVFERHARSPVQFVRALEQCAEADADLYLQVGAGGPLASFARRTVGKDAKAVLTLANMEDQDGGRSLLTNLGWLWVHGVALDLSSITGAAHVAAVPPSVLPRQDYWAVKTKVQKSLKLSHGTGAPVVENTVAVEVIHDSGDQVYDKVVEVLARVSSYPRDAVQNTQRLIEDLGFDSLMVADLATGLADAFPGLGGLPQELLINGPTVQDISDYVAGAKDGHSAADDNAPLLSWQPCWRPTTLPDNESLASLAGTSALVVGQNDYAQALFTALIAADVTPTLVTESEAATAEKTDLVIWCGATDLPSVGDVFAGERDTPSPAGPFIAALDRQSQLRNTPNVVLVRTSDNPWSAQLSGAVRAVAREWPKSICKNIVTAGFSADRLADAVLLDLVSDDRTIDVRWTAEGRAVMGLEIVTAIESATIGAGDTVLITGGTRGIGLNMGVRLAAAGAKVILVGRSAPSGDNATVVAEHNLTAVQADVTDRAALAAAITDVGPIHAVVHCAGILADGPLGEVDASAGARARSVKIDGWLNALSVAGGSLKVALGIGSWAGRFGNRHQTHYAAANAQLAALANHAPPGVRAIVAEFGPWSESEMVRTIPAAIQAAMRAEGIDFVTDEAGLDALMADLNGGSGIAVHGRTLPSTTRRRVSKLTLSVNTHPFLTDHAIEGVPVLPLAGAADLVAQIAGLAHPFEVADLRVFGGVAVREALHVEVSVNGERAEIRTGDRRSLAYQARVRPASNVPERAPLAGGDALPLSIADFYKDVTFHGPLLAGVRTLDGVGPDFARGTVATASPAEWEPATQRAAFSVDPLALDSAFQLSAMVAWERYHRAGTPVSMGRYVQISPMPTGTLQVDVHFGESNSDRFSADFWFRDDQGNVVAIVQDAVAELKQLASDEPAMELKAEWTDAGLWPEVKDLEMRLEAAGVMGIRNPFFTVHEGTARNITQVDGKELINFSSYNYLGLSGDPRVLADVHAAVDKYGTSVSASRVASGERPFHQELEALLAKSQGCEDSLVFTAGHATNVTTIGHLFGPGDLILHDEFIHDSALQGIKLSGAGRRSFKHDDPVALEALLKDLRPHQEKVLIIVEGVYSMDGDICNLPAYVALKKKYGCMLMVDEAHSFGVIGETGCGLAEYYGIQGNEVDLWMGTLSKSLASCGGWIAASKRLINYLRYTAPGFVFSAGITAANAQAALSSLKLMLAESDRVIKLQHNSKLFHDELVRQGVDTGPAKGGSAVVPAITGNSFHALMLSQRLVDQGINVQPIVYPAVADDAARLRFFLSSTHTDDQLIHVAERVAKTLVEVRVEFAI